MQAIDVTERGHVRCFEAQLDGADQTVKVDPANYPDFTHGYAATVHKVQGITVKHSLVYADGTYWNRHLTTVAMTRHQETCQLYVNKTTHSDMTALKQQLGRNQLKDSTLDYPLAFAERRGIDTQLLSKTLTKHLKEKLMAWKDDCVNRYQHCFYPETYQQQDKQTKEAITTHWQALLQQYVEMELTQTDLVKAYYEAKLNQHSDSQLLQNRCHQQHQALQAFAKQVMASSEIKAMQQNKTIQTPLTTTLAQRGGYQAIYERLCKKEWLPEDTQILLKALHQRAVKKSHQQVRNRAQEGRSQS